MRDPLCSILQMKWNRIGICSYARICNSSANERNLRKYNFIYLNLNYVSKLYHSKQIRWRWWYLFDVCCTLKLKYTRIFTAECLLPLILECRTRHYHRHPHPRFSIHSSPKAVSHAAHFFVFWSHRHIGNRENCARPSCHNNQFPK